MSFGEWTAVATGIRLIWETHTLFGESKHASVYISDLIACLLVNTRHYYPDGQLKTL